MKLTRFGLLFTFALMFTAGWGRPSSLARQVLQGLTVSPSSVTGGTSSVGTVTLSTSAGPSGSVISLSSNSPTASVPASVTVPAGSKTATFAIATTPVNVVSPATITATGGGIKQSAQLTVNPPTVTGISISPTSVGGGSMATGTVTISGPAVGAPDALNVQVKSSSPVASVYPFLTFPGGSTSTTFTITTYPTNTKTLVTISASFGSSVQSAQFTVEPASLTSVKLSDPQVVGGSQTAITGSVSMNGTPATSGKVITLSSSDPKLVSVPKSVQLVSTESWTKFTVIHRRVATAQSVTISANCDGVTQTTTLTLEPFALTSFKVGSLGVTGGLNALGAIILNAAPGTDSGPVSVKMTSSSSVVDMPKTVLVPVGSTSKEFAIPTVPVKLSTEATLTATLGSTQLTGSVVVNPPYLVSMAIKPTSVTGSSTTTVTGTVTLSGPAPTGGISITLASADPAAAGVEPTVVVPAGKTTATFAVTHKKVTTQTQVRITAALGNVNTIAVLTVTP